MRRARAVFEAAYLSVGKPLDLESIRDEAYDNVYNDAEDACIYYSDCMEIISVYEGDVDVRDIRGLTGHRTFTADQWQDAMQLYATEIAIEVLKDRICDTINDLESVAANLAFRACDFVGINEVSASDLTLTTEFPYGHIPHDSEDADGTCLWITTKLDGLCAVSRKADCGLWLSYTWDHTQTPHYEHCKEMAEREGVEKTLLANKLKSEG